LPADMQVVRWFVSPQHIWLGRKARKVVHVDWKNQSPPANPPASDADRSRNKDSRRGWQNGGTCPEAHVGAA